ncbi:AEC family transporter [Chthonobacter albigriseus]|uniref:AEC family transporter n=1 Tax=Chthonobacter albigriseus TaxID=1683161 RepID=UPI0015EE43E6|nr:AEC family transporter [Chthonobacter albigriseus]
MLQVVTLALPFFGVILIGYVSGKIAQIPRSGLAWLDFYLLYVALPALFFDLISKTPIEELARGSFILATTAATFTAFVISYAVGQFFGEKDTRIGTIRALVGSYANVGYMGIGLTLAALGPTASAPVALVFCFDVALVFTVVPVIMTLSGKDKRGIGGTLLLVVRRVFLHPFILATLIGAAAAAVQLETPAPIAATLQFLKNSAAPAALFAIGVTVALQPVGRGAPEIPWLLAVKLVVHPLIAWLFVTTIGGFEPVWVQAAIIMAALPPATTIFVAAQQYDTYVNRAATAILIGTAVSVFTVTGVLYLVTHDMVPM